MYKLIRLEWKKNRIGKDIRNALILLFCLGFFVYAVDFRFYRAACQYVLYRILRRNAGLLYCEGLQKQNHEPDVFLSCQKAEDPFIPDACGVDL